MKNVLFDNFIFIYVKKCFIVIFLLLNEIFLCQVFAHNTFYINKLTHKKIE